MNDSNSETIDDDYKSVTDNNVIEKQLTIVPDQQAGQMII